MNIAAMVMCSVIGTIIGATIVMVIACCSLSKGIEINVNRWIDED